MKLKEGDFVLVDFKGKRLLKRVVKGKTLTLKGENLNLESLVGLQIPTRLGSFYLLEPTLEDLILYGFKRETQIIYPKDAFFIAYKLDLSKEKKVFEFGSGSGALTAVLSRLAGEVYSFEIRERFYKLTRENLQKFSLDKNVKLYNQDFLEANLEGISFDAGFIDVKEPWLYLDKALSSLKGGGVLGFLLPTTNQVSRLLKELNGRVCCIEVLEILLRYYKTNPERLRPEDRMVAHTGFLLFCRKV